MREKEEGLVHKGVEASGLEERRKNAPYAVPFPIPGRLA